MHKVKTDNGFSLLQIDFLEKRMLWCPLSLNSPGQTTLQDTSQKQFKRHSSSSWQRTSSRC